MDSTAQIMGSARIKTSEPVDIIKDRIRPVVMILLRMDADKLGYGDNFTIYTDLESERVVKRVCENVHGAD